MPALFTRMSIFPNSPIAALTTLLICSSSLTSSAYTAALPPAAVICAATASSFSRLRAASATAAPASASFRAHAWPIPCEAPVTSATRPDKFMASPSPRCPAMQNEKVYAPPASGHPPCVRRSFPPPASEGPAPLLPFSGPFAFVVLFLPLPPPKFPRRPGRTLRVLCVLWFSPSPPSRPCELCRHRHQDRRPPDVDQVLRADFQPRVKQHEDRSDFGDGLQRVTGMDPPQRMWADQHSRQDFSQHRRGCARSKISPMNFAATKIANNPNSSRSYSCVAREAWCL